ncbi:MAG: WD40/YVTN/BNR-like repeat-containing protein [Pseudomonadales bacterium]
MSTEGVPLKSGNVLIVSTRKGIFFLQADPDRRNWQLSGPVFLGHIVNHAVLDPRNGQTMIAAAVTGHLGPTVFRSEDAGRTWIEARQPPAFDKAKAGDTPRVVGHTFWLAPGHPSEPGVWFAGTSPQALWTSTDDGRSWASMRGFNDHPDYGKRTEDPQAGTPDGPVLHSILIDPRNSNHMYLGLSGGGVYETTDHGESWAPLNHGMATTSSELNIQDTETMEVAYGDLAWQEMGPQHDPHCVQMHPIDPNVLYQQNHCGIYRLERPGTTWDRIGSNMPAEVGDIGFVMGLNPLDVDVCWVFPMDGTDVWPRTSPDGRPAVFKTRNAGTSWERQDSGLPERGWYTVKRQALSVDEEDSVGIYFGTTSGEVWGSIDEGQSWSCLIAHLPEIYAVEAAVIG